MKKIIFNVNNATTELSTVEEQVVLFKDDGEYHYKKGILHDEDEPALVKKGSKMWYKEGELHRDGDEPAVIKEHEITYYKNGKIHRDGDKPAKIDTSSDTSSYVYCYTGYRLPLPSYFSTQKQENPIVSTYYINGLLARVAGGPVCEITFKCNDFYYKFEYFYKNGHTTQIIGTELIHPDQKTSTGSIIYYKYYNNRGVEHCEAGPACYSKYDDNMTIYYIDGKEHRTDGPSYKSDTSEKWKENDRWKHRVNSLGHTLYNYKVVVKIPGSDSTYIDEMVYNDVEQLHNLDGPASVRTYRDGGVAETYYVKGRMITKSQFKSRKFWGTLEKNRRDY